MDRDKRPEEEEDEEEDDDERDSDGSSEEDDEDDEAADAVARIRNLKSWTRGALHRLDALLTQYHSTKNRMNPRTRRQHAKLKRILSPTLEAMESLRQMIVNSLRPKVMEWLSPEHEFDEFFHDDSFCLLDKITLTTMFGQDPKFVAQLATDGDMPRLRALSKIFETSSHDDDLVVAMWCRVRDVQKRIKRPQQKQHLAETCSILGNFYHQRGSTNRALAHYAKALKIRKEELGSNHLGTAQCYINMGHACIDDETRRKEGLGYFCHALVIYQQRLEEDDERLLDLLKQIALTTMDGDECNGAACA